MAKSLLDLHHSEMFKENHPYYQRKDKVWVNKPCPVNKQYDSFFISSKTKGNDVDLDGCGYIYVKDTIKIYALWSSELFREKKMNKELIIFCHDKFNRKLDCHEGRLFKVKMIDYEPDKHGNSYFSFKIIERITPGGYLYDPSLKRY
jgi:hypothetical protein